MPKIAASSVKEHHSNVFNTLLDTAERIMREQGPSALTAGSVAKGAGIARNSIYRYVNSIDDLRIHVLERYLPKWTTAMREAIDSSAPASEQLLALTRQSLEMAKTTGHSWLISVLTGGKQSMGGKPGVPVIEQGALPKSSAIMEFHEALIGQITALWRELTPENAIINARVNAALIECGMEQIDKGENPDYVIHAVCSAVSGMITP